jgi:hypothetical protein
MNHSMEVVLIQVSSKTLFVKVYKTGPQGSCMKAYRGG